MIEAHWKLARRPFANSPDPAFIYRSPIFAEGMARLMYDATELRGGLSLITGEIGCGKTMLAHALADRLSGSACDVIALPYPKVTPAQMLGRLATGLGIERPPRGKLPLIEAIGRRLQALNGNGRRPVLVVDEAQLAGPALFEEIRLLTNHEDRQNKHLHVILLGQPELRDRVRQRPQIDQRVSLRFHVDPMEEEDVRGYVEHRLGVAGASQVIFSPDALRLVAARSGGVPRRVNTIAAQALFVGAMRRLAVIDAELVGDVADEHTS